MLGPPVLDTCSHEEQMVRRVLSTAVFLALCRQVHAWDRRCRTTYSPGKQIYCIATEADHW